MGESNVLNFTEASQSTSAIPNTSRRRLDTPHGEKIHRSNTSIAMRKRGFQEDKGNENENDKIETESSHTISSVDYEWKGSRKKLVMQYFLAIWKELCEMEMINYTEKTEMKIRSDVSDLLCYNSIVGKSITER